MFHSEYYAARLASIDAEIRRKQITASLIFSENKLRQRRARAAIKRLEILRRDYDALAAIASQEASQGA